MALLQTLTDNFDQTTLNTGLWTQFTAGSATMSYSATGAKVNFPTTSSGSTDGDITSVSSYDLTGSYAYMQVVNTLGGVNNDQNLTLLSPTAANAYQWQLEAGTLFAQRIKASVQTNAFSITYNATSMKYLRIANLAGTSITWDTSPDGVTWTNRLTFTNNITITAVKINIAGVAFGADTSAGNFQFNNFNNIPSVNPTLVVQDANQAQTSPNVAIDVALLVNAANQAQTADLVDLSTILAIQNASMTQTAPNVILDTPLTVQNAGQTQTADGNLTLTTSNILAVQNASMTQTADGLLQLTQIHYGQWVLVPLPGATGGWQAVPPGTPGAQWQALTPTTPGGVWSTTIPTASGVRWQHIPVAQPAAVWVPSDFQ